MKKQKRFMAQVKDMFYAVDIYATSKTDAIRQLKEHYGFKVRSIWVA
jgi:hypothetical protein